MVLQKNKPQNYIVPVDRDSIEMKTVELLAGPEGAHIFRFTTTDEYNSLKLYISEYISGELISKEHLDLSFNEVGTPENGQLLFVPDFTNFVIKIIIATDGTKCSTEIPILADVPNREYYGRSATGISEATEIKYNEEQALVAFLYDKEGLRVSDLSNSISEQKDFLEGNDYIYYFSYEFLQRIEQDT